LKRRPRSQRINPFQAVSSASKDRTTAYCTIAESDILAMSTAKKCTACHAVLTKEIIHPLLYVPICTNCDFQYQSGEFTIENGNEIFCRFCGEGEDSLLLCDSCPKSFCCRCIGNALGMNELRRIQSLSDRWHCLVCSPQPLQDLYEKHGWKYHCRFQVQEKKQSRKGLVYADISRGRERFEIPVINEVDSAGPPLDFTYVAEPVAGAGVILSNNPNNMDCCSCTDNCKDPKRCECALKMGGIFPYEAGTGTKLRDVPGGIFECNAHCACNVNRCQNRVVGKGPALRLEVFRCDNPAKGWGVRCKTDIAEGTYITDYLGEILFEEDAEKRGLTINDEYLFTLDFWGRLCADRKLEELKLTGAIKSVPLQLDVDALVLEEEDVRQYLDDELVDLLAKKGAIKRALSMGKKLRENPHRFMHLQDLNYSNQVGPDVLYTEGGGSDVRGGKMNKLLDLDRDNIGELYGEEDEELGRMKYCRQSKTKSKNQAKILKLKNRKRPLGKNEGRNREEDDLVKDALQELGADNSKIHEEKPFTSWTAYHAVARQKALEQAKSIILDRTVLETEDMHQTFTVDAR
jgi:hypothetical protein